MFGGGLILLSGLAAIGYFMERPGWDFDDDKPGESFRLWDEIRDEFNVNRNDAFLVVRHPEFFSSETAARLHKLVAAVEGLDSVRSVFWFDKVQSLNSFGLASSLLPPADSSAAAFRDAKDRTLEHPLIVGQLLSADGETALMPLRIDWMNVTSDEDCTQAIVETARQAVSDDPQFEIQITGPTPVMVDQQNSFNRTTLRFQVIGYGLTILLAAFLFRGVAAVVIVSGAPALGIFWSLGVLGWIGEPNNPLTNPILPVLLAMVGIADGVHIMIHIRRKRIDGLSPVAASASAIREIGLACGLTSFTTAVGFGSLMLAHSEFVQGFGRACAIGVVITFLAVIGFIPFAASMRWARNVHHGQQRDVIDHWFRKRLWVVDGILKRRRSVFGFALLCTLVLAWIAVHLVPDDRMSDRLPSDSQAVATLKYLDATFGGLERMSVVIDWSSDLEGDDPQILQVIRQVEAELNREPLVQYPMSIRNLVESIPGQQGDAARMSLLQVIPESITSEYIDRNQRRTLVYGRVQDLGIADYVPVFERLETNLKELAKANDGFQIGITGIPVVRARRLGEMVTDLIRSLGAASVIIMITLALAYRSVRVGLISVIPNVFPLVVTACLLLILDMPLDLSAVCAFTVCLGIAVDDTIHFLSRYQLEVDRGESVEQSIRIAFQHVGTPLVTTTLVMVVGFSTVLLSELPMQRTFAAMACATIASALVGDLLFLPAILACFGRSGNRAIPSLERRPSEADALRDPPSEAIDA